MLASNLAKMDDSDSWQQNTEKLTNHTHVPTTKGAIPHPWHTLYCSCITFGICITDSQVRFLRESCVFLISLKLPFFSLCFFFLCFLMKALFLLSSSLFFHDNMSPVILRYYCGRTFQQHGMLQQSCCPKNIYFCRNIIRICSDNNIDYTLNLFLMRFVSILIAVFIHVCTLLTAIYRICKLRWYRLVIFYLVHFFCAYEL